MIICSSTVIVKIFFLWLIHNSLLILFSLHLFVWLFQNVFHTLGLNTYWVICFFVSPLPSGDSSVLHLHERWLKDCAFYRDIYEQVDDVSLMPRIDWGPVLNQKQVRILTLNIRDSLLKNSLKIQDWC